MSFTRHHYQTHAEKTNDFLLGFVGWSLLNVTFGSALMLGPSPINYSGQQHTIVVFFVAALVFVSWMLNIGFLVYFGFTRYWIALGILVAWAAIALLVLLLQAAMDVLCSAISRLIIGS
jgi:hypothetical protein